MTRQPALPDLGSDAVFEHTLLATAFHLLLADARPVSPARLAAALPGDPARVERTPVPLDRHGRLHRDPERGVTGSHGLSATPTRHELLLLDHEQERRYWTWCAWDAVGILAALGASGRVRSTSRSSGAPIELVFHQGSPRRADPELVVFVADTDCGTPATDTDATGSCAPGRSSTTAARWSTSSSTPTPPRPGPPSTACVAARSGWPRRPAKARPRGRSGSPTETCISGPGDVGLGADQLGVSHDGDQDP